MEKQKLYWIILFGFMLKGFAICEDRNSIFNLYNPDVVIQSAFINDGINLEYSIPDLTTFSHIRLTFEFDSSDALHLGVGYATIDVGISTHLLNWHKNSLRFMFIGGISGVKTALFGQAQLISSLYNNKKTEFGINFSVGYNLYLPAEVYYDDSPIAQIAKDYKDAGQPDLYLKQELYYLYQLILNVKIGIATGITEGFYFYESGDNFRFQLGASIQYCF